MVLWVSIKSIRTEHRQVKYTSYLLRSFTPGSEVVGSSAEAKAHNATRARASSALFAIMMIEVINKICFESTEVSSNQGRISELSSKKEAATQIYHLSNFYHCT
jgi:hypothetical protein